MKFHSLLLLLPALAAAPSASAQFSIDEVDARQENVTFRDPVKSTPVDVAYFNRARYRAERAAIRKERNKLEFGAKLVPTACTLPTSTQPKGTFFPFCL